MKTPDVALTEWACDDIKFDYQQGKGPQSHNRDQFKKLCNGFRKDESGIDSVTSIGSGHLISGSVMLATISQPARDFIGDLADFRTFSAVRSAVSTFMLIMGSKVPQAELPRMLDQYFTPMSLMHCETVQDVITGLFKKAQL